MATLPSSATAKSVRRINVTQSIPTQQENNEPHAPGEAEVSPITEAKARKKPRKLVRNLPSAQHVPKRREKQTDGTEITDPNIDARLQKLERQFQSVNGRLDRNAREIGALQARGKTSGQSRQGNGMMAPSTTPKAGPSNGIGSTVAVESVEQQFRPSNAESTFSSEGKPRRRTPLQHVVQETNEDEAENDEDVETIPRSDPAMTTSKAITDPQRTLALTGNYKIPLPSTLSTEDVKAIQSGLAAAGSVAREISNAVRAQGGNHEELLQARDSKDLGTYARRISEFL